MRNLLTIWLLIVCWSSCVSADELRVLMSFSAAGHRVEKVLTVEAGPVSARVQGLQSRSIEKAVFFGVLLQWLDSAGNVLVANVIADPRVTHAPTRAGPIPDKFLKPRGVYLVNGPADSKQLRLTFPAVTLSSQLIPVSTLVLPLTTY